MSREFKLGDKVYCTDPYLRNIHRGKGTVIRAPHNNTNADRDKLIQVRFNTHTVSLYVFRFALVSPIILFEELLKEKLNEK